MPASTPRDERHTGGASRAASKDSTPEPLRGDAAFRAAVKEIAKRNDAARAAGARRRAAGYAEAAAEAARLAKREAQGMPRQPGR